MERSGRLAPPRVPTLRGLYASFPGGVAVLRELTLRGAVLEDRDPLPIGSRLRLTLHLGSENVQCVGLVKRSIADEGMAVEFVDISAPDRTHLFEYLTAVAAAKSRARLNASLSNATRPPSIAPAPSGSTPGAKPPASLPRLAELLIRRGTITADRLAAAAAEYRRRGGRFCAVLLQLGVVSDKALAACFNEEYRIPLIDVTTIDPTPEALRLVPYELAQRHEILPIGVTPSTLTVATSDPTNLDGRDEVKLRSGCDLMVTVAPSRMLREAIHYFYHERAREAG
jgi:Type II secretion system (T2SS), protein E, N-terminal domain/PilZ domain